MTDMIDVEVRLDAAVKALDAAVVAAREAECEGILVGRLEELAEQVAAVRHEHRQDMAG